MLPPLHVAFVGDREKVLPVEMEMLEICRPLRLDLRHRDEHTASAVPPQQRRLRLVSRLDAMLRRPQPIAEVRNREPPLSPARKASAAWAPSVAMDWTASNCPPSLSTQSVLLTRGVVPIVGSGPRSSERKRYRLPCIVQPSASCARILGGQLKARE